MTNRQEKIAWIEQNVKQQTNTVYDTAEQPDYAIYKRWKRERKEKYMSLEKELERLRTKRKTMSHVLRHKYQLDEKIHDVTTSLAQIMTGVYRAEMIWEGKARMDFPYIEQVEEIARRKRLLT